MGIPTWTSGEVLTASDVNAWFVPLNSTKPTDQSVTSSTTLVSDNDLVLAVAASVTYNFTGWLSYTGGTQGSSDLKFQWTVPSGATLRWDAVYIDTGGANRASISGGNLGASATLAAATNSSTSSFMSVKIFGFLTVSSTPGNLQLQWAQNTSSGTATTMRAGSWINLQRTA